MCLFLSDLPRPSSYYATVDPSARDGVQSPTYIIGENGVKFKLIFFLFNVIILLSFAVVLLMPFFLLGPEYTRSFWSTSWYLPLVFLAAIALIDAYFLIYWRMLTLLEEEKWSELITYLEDQCFRREKLRSQFVRTLVNAYFITNEVSRIEELEKKVREKKPGLLRKLALQFGIPKMLHKNPDDIVRYFEEFKDARVPKREWVRFLYAFGLLMKRENTDGREVLLKLIRESRDPVLRLVALYTVDPFKTIDDEVLSLVDSQRKELSSRFTRQGLEEQMSKQKDNIVVIVLSRLISDALDWLYGGGEAEDPAAYVRETEETAADDTPEKDTPAPDDTEETS